MMVPLDIFSDPICPWCYIGKTRLDRAIAKHVAEGGVSPFLIRWRPFQLNPDMPAEGMDRKTYLERKFGGPEGAQRVYGHIEQTARGDGLEIDFAKITKTPNTIDAHRLIRWAEVEGLQGPVVDALFDRYFVQGADISSHETLLAIAEEAGLDRSVIAQLLAGDSDREAIVQEDIAAREAGLSGVPSFIINGKHLIPGAVDGEVWDRVIAELTDAIAAAETAPAEPDT